MENTRCCALHCAARAASQRRISSSRPRPPMPRSCAATTAITCSGSRTACSPPRKRGASAFRGRPGWSSVPGVRPAPPFAACRTALTDGCGVNMAGGTHHAHRDFGAGFCVFNDAAIAARAMQAEGAWARWRSSTATSIRAMAPPRFSTATPASSPSACTAQEITLPQGRSDLDIELEDATGDASYLAHLGEGLERVFAHCRPELVIYLAGADPFIDDRLGRLALSRDGLLARDRMVLETCRRHSVPIAIAMAGGYARNIADTVAIHAATILLASERLA